MRGLSPLPSSSALALATETLLAALHARGARLPSEEDLALWSQWVRFDPRLGEVWIQWVAQSWSRLDALALNSAFEAQPWPAVAGVLLDHVRIRDPRFRAWRSLALAGIRPAHRGALEQFFIGLRAFAGEAGRQDILEAARPFEKWGYGARDLLLNKAFARKDHTWMSRSKRLAKLRVLQKKFAREGRILRASDYLREMRGAVSQRQAQLDLQTYLRRKS